MIVYFRSQGKDTSHLCIAYTVCSSLRLGVRCAWVCVLECACVLESEMTLFNPQSPFKGIMKICVASLTVTQCWSSGYYDCHYQIAKPTGHVTHQPTQTAHSKQHFIPCLTAHHCPLGGMYATANGLPLIIKVLSQMSRKYYTYRMCQALTKHCISEGIGQV